VTAVASHPVLWASPAPLWGRFATGDVPGATSAQGVAAFRTEDQARPAILRFDTDEFMDRLLALLAADPRRLGETLARPETWRDQAGGTPDLVARVPLARIARALARVRTAEAAAPAVAATVREATARENGIERIVPLKLYHPAHQRHYLVAANLVCGIPGFPDRAVAGGGREQVGFVLRRLLSPDEANPAKEPVEFAFVKDAEATRWQRVTEGQTTAPGEELLPLFPLAFRDDAGHPRRILTGSIPVGRREEYMSTRANRALPSANGSGIGGGAPETAMSARKEQLKMEVAEPWKNLVRSAHAAAPRINDVDAGTVDNIVQKQLDAARAANAQLQGQSWLLLLDLADYLQHHLAPVWAAIVAPAKRAGLGEAEQRLFDWLDGTGPAAGVQWPAPGPALAPAASLRDALARIRSSEAVRRSLEGAVRSFPDAPGPGLAWPDFAFLLAGIRQKTDGTYEPAGPYEKLGGAADPSPAPGDFEPPLPAGSVLAKVEGEAARLDRLVQLVIAAIDAKAPPKTAPPLPFAARLRDALASTNGDPGWFVLRCAYVRCDCGPLQPTVLSVPSQRFQLASFFDPDAPARPIRITLPLDTTPAGMRKFNKNTAFMISDVLCGQVQRAKGLGFIDLVLAVLPWPLHKDLNVGGMGPCERSGINIGMICSLSIPIITICALILLIIIVTLLDLIFHWIPWFIMCFPVPGLKGKRP
jgi:hypothetical protein